jgi:ribosome-associated protein
VIGDLQVPGGPLIPARELRWRYSGSGGPGGQHANTSNTRAEVFFDVASSEALSEVERQLITERLGPLVRVVASDERSQLQNRRLAMERLRDRIAEALDVAPDRRPTAPSRRELRRRRQTRQYEQKRRQLRRWTYRGDE